MPETSGGPLYDSDNAFFSTKSILYLGCRDVCAPQINAKQGTLAMDLGHYRDPPAYDRNRFPRASYISRPKLGTSVPPDLYGHTGARRVSTHF
jgi:hypothetical protein